MFNSKIERDKYNCMSTEGTEGFFIFTGYYWLATHSFLNNRHQQTKNNANNNNEWLLNQESGVPMPNTSTSFEAAMESELVWYHGFSWVPRQTKALNKTTLLTRTAKILALKKASIYFIAQIYNTDHIKHQKSPREIDAHERRNEKEKHPKR